jgi:hypothetical protein
LKGGGAGLSTMFSTTDNMRRRKYAFSSDDSGSPFATSCVVAFEMRNADAAREKVLQFVEEFNGLSTSSSSSTPSHAAAAAVEVCDSKLRPLPPSSATTKLLLLESAQAQHRVFCDPRVVKAYRLAEDSHKGQVRKTFPLMFLHTCISASSLEVYISLSLSLSVLQLFRVVSCICSGCRCPLSIAMVLKDVLQHL